ncbi:multiheme c-type cytochrome [Minwuia sp.]|uniref:multiheme c-type cytochrome n=1 Tax=Minwuia sp. TaxID=2493630 RepID=UPI003A9368D4
MSGLRQIGLALATAAGLWMAGAAAQAQENVGPTECKDCHGAEYKVWEGTPHAESYKDIHKRDMADKVTEAVGERSMKRSETCGQCHYTQAPKKAGGRVGNNFGPSCESCHGPGSEYINIHNVYGPKGTKKEDETPLHKTQRYKEAAAAGMRWPRWRDDIPDMPASVNYEVAQNCFNCHGMARDSLDGDTAAKMLAAGHPLNPDFELVKYSQGQVRHRFYDSQTENKEMTPAELSRWFVTGQAASLVQAENAMKKTSDAKYVAAQKARASKAVAALKAVGMPEADALIAAPTADNARALVAKIYKGNMDLTGKVGSMLPSKSEYK